jgi:amino-acid N-acetyltransferase
LISTLTRAALIRFRGHRDGQSQARRRRSGGILRIIEPLEELGVLVRRSRERLESEIERSSSPNTTNVTSGCAGAVRVPRRARASELGRRLPLHPDFAAKATGGAPARDRAAREAAAPEPLVVLTTKTAHWFPRAGVPHSPASATCRSRSRRSTITTRKSQV